MGCCGSKESTHEPNESTHLLSANNTATESVPGQPTMVAHNYEAEAIERETASLNEIVQRTAENLIDISRIHSIERVKLQDAAMRSEEYQQVLNGSDELKTLAKESKRLSQIFENPNGVTETGIVEGDEDKVEQLLGNNLSQSNRRKVDSFNQFTTQLANNLENIQVDSNTDFIVPLTFGSNTPTIANH